ncbi:DUF4294 domain-containing protein [Chryseobacterium lacus]|uniref:DUF4294 domain-containing protein n=1 Tax=Chryseobacterium lacus TaxID=2058346 RepID=A0A368MWL8_9FLAO|nr:DUF4294 domain-containing protein [Chryseobacterium lacus]ODS89714.1 MAG: molecular chaperone DnaJ [Chryseobacterium sp. SCN 40-13]RCU42330.1 DUF4294 domain-containing protein [Chryseobacterium lacus]RST26259.1 DUF4294 domain-containing protein [Chryseobacterium lacus]RST26626.1 DUF4294 domain-containing protein [Chryseobacterium lacus]
MKIYQILLIVLLLGSSVLKAQDSVMVKSLSQYPNESLRTDEFGQKYYYDERQKAKIYEINGESVVVMDELVLMKNPRFNNQLDRNYYYFLNKKLNRVYPLFLTALEQYTDIQNDLKNLDKNNQRKYIKKRQQDLATQYEAQLRDLTTSEGRVFAKLMNRATGKTVYEIIKELRGGWSAFWWNVKGNIADVDIKEPYDPHKNRTDLFVESLLQTNWNFGYLQPYPGAENFRIKK